MVWLVVSALIAVQANTAMRKSEVTLPDACKTWHKGLVCWDHVKWLINGKYMYYAELTQALYDMIPSCAKLKTVTVTELNSFTEL